MMESETMEMFPDFAFEEMLQAFGFSLSNI